METIRDEAKEIAEPSWTCPACGEKEHPAATVHHVSGQTGICEHCERRLFDRGILMPIPPGAD